MATQEQYIIVDQFNSAYWSGQNVDIYANNIHIEEAIQLNFTISEQVRPYYSYSSYVADKIFHGSRIIAGELTLNFKRDSYIYSLMNLIRESSTDDWIQQTPIESGPSILKNAGPSYRPSASFNNTPWGPQTDPAQLVNGEIARKWMDAKKAQSSELAVNSFAADIPVDSGMYETKPHGFNLKVIMGGGLKSAQTLRFEADSDNYYLDNTVLPAPNVTASTGLRLLGTEITGVARSMGDDGRSFVETYTFMAKDVQVLQSSEVKNNPRDDTRRIIDEYFK